MQRALSYTGSKGRDKTDFIYSSRVVRVGNGRRLKAAAVPNLNTLECTQREEIYMCTNGSLFPTVNHIDNPLKRIGTLVRIVSVN